MVRPRLEPSVTFGKTSRRTVCPALVGPEPVTRGITGAVHTAGRRTGAGSRGANGRAESARAHGGAGRGGAGKSGGRGLGRATLEGFASGEGGLAVSGSEGE